MHRWQSQSGRLLLLQLLQGDRRAQRAVARLDAPRWEPRWLRWVARRNRAVRKQPVKQQQAVASSLAFELDELRKVQARRRIAMSNDQSGFRGTREHLRMLERSLGAPDGGSEWNEWRRRNPRVRPKLRGANLSNLDLVDLQLHGADLRSANLSGSNLSGVALRLADLRDAQGFNVDFNGAGLERCKLAGAWFHHSSFGDANLSGAHLGGAFVTDCSLNHTDLSGAVLSDVHLWGCSTWGVTIDERTVQSGICIASDFDWVEFSMLSARERRQSASERFDISIDDLRVADFVSQIRDYPERVADIINAATSKLVLLLGRFTGPQRAILDEVLVPTLAGQHYIPMVFDFRPPDGRDVIESVAILAGLSHFVIADLTDPRSTPLESQLLAPMLAIPFFPIVQRGDRVFSMFSDLQRKYPWVQPPRTYRGKAHLTQLLNEWVIPTAEREAKKWTRRKQRRGE